MNLTSLPNVFQNCAVFVLVSIKEITDSAGGTTDQTNFKISDQPLTSFKPHCPFLMAIFVASCCRSVTKYFIQISSARKMGMIYHEAAVNLLQSRADFMITTP